MKKRHMGHKILRGLYHYFLFFVLVAFLVTCTTMLFAFRAIIAIQGD